VLIEPLQTRRGHAIAPFAASRPGTVRQHKRSLTVAVVARGTARSNLTTTEW
jgi:hypothetical protein